MDTTALLASLNTTMISIGWKLLGALVLWIGGRMLIRFAMRLLGGGMRSQGIEGTWTANVGQVYQGCNETGYFSALFISN